MTPQGGSPFDRAYAGSSAAPFTIAAYGTIFLLFIYYMLQLLDFPVLPISELFWNAFVHITPIQVIDFLNPSATSLRENAASAGSKSIGHARKSEVMRQILGLDGARMMSKVQRARSLSGIGAMIKGTSSVGPPGLGNWDNSCYQNSILQGLAALQSLPNHLSRIAPTKTINTTATLGELLKRLNDPRNAGKMYWTPSELKSMSSWQQQDAQEYFSKVLDEVEKESRTQIGAGMQDQGLAGLAGLTSEVANEESKDAPESSQDHPASSDPKSVQNLPDEVVTIIARNPLEGLLAQRVGCLRCGYVEGLSMIPFNCLTVSLGRQWMYDIRSCLDEYTKLEPIDGVECAKCTLLQTKKQLEKLLSQIQTQTSEDEGQQTAERLVALKDSSKARLTAVDVALDEEDFSENTLLKKCEISAKNRVSTTKTRQAVVARAPQSLAIHVNRSVFDEYTGAQTKNFADVRFPHDLDFSPWCLGMSSESKDVEKWTTDPASSMVAQESEEIPSHLQQLYQLRAVVTHYGRHENGHYICYKRYPSSSTKPEDQSDGEQMASRWWRLSDDDVSPVSEENVLAQGGVFMLFYEQADQRDTARLDVTDISTEEVHIIASEIPAETAPVAETIEELVHPALDDETGVQASVSGSSHTESEPSRAFTKAISPSTFSAPSPDDASEPTEEASSPSPPPELPVKDNPQIAPRMRTAPPRSGRGSKSMGQVSSMVTAN